MFELHSQKKELNKLFSQNNDLLHNFFYNLIGMPLSILELVESFHMANTFLEYDDRREQKNMVDTIT